ncbi:hypothetical protein P3342_012022 [Pyrenophora teres f. teres]|nr:hypothetical protein P3342_012022 [Pyrenophora teres f. teres]
MSYYPGQQHHGGGYGAPPPQNGYGAPPRKDIPLSKTMGLRLHSNTATRTNQHPTTTMANPPHHHSSMGTTRDRHHSSTATMALRLRSRLLLLKVILHHVT